MPSVLGYGPQGTGPIPANADLVFQVELVDLRTRAEVEAMRAQAAQRKAASICRHCTVLLQCRADALDNRVEFGVWGGMTERQRRALLKQHPEVRSWADFFAQQIERHTVIY